MDNVVQINQPNQVNQQIQTGPVDFSECRIMASLIPGLSACMFFANQKFIQNEYPTLAGEYYYDLKARQWAYLTVSTFIKLTVAGSCLIDSMTREETSIAYVITSAVATAYTLIGVIAGTCKARNYRKYSQLVHAI